MLNFLLTLLHTTYLDDKAYGAAGFVRTTADMLIPLVSLGISNAVIRFGLEKANDKRQVFTNGLLAIGLGFIVLLLFSPLISLYDAISDYVVLLYVYILVSCLRTLCCQFVRAKMQLRLYALDGILTTGYTIAFNFLFLAGLNMGTNGYILAIICADAASTIFLFIMSRLWEYIDFRHFSKTFFATMLRYSLPLVPALMMWWVIQQSDIYFIEAMIGMAAVGMYEAATKIPNLVNIITTVFTEAWQLSAVTDGQGRDRERFFSQVFSALSGGAFFAGGALILLTRFIMGFLVTPRFYDAWHYVPILIVATVFASLVAFQNSVYMVERKSHLSLITMAVGAGANLALNALLIPAYGVYGAAIATAISYVLIFIVRAFNTRTLIRVDFSPLRMVANTLLLAGQAFILIKELPLWGLWCSLILAALLALNGAALLRTARQLLRKKTPPGAGGGKIIYRAGSGQFMD